jgi:type II secretory pathway component PulF
MFVRIAEGKQLHEAMGSHRDVFSDLTLSIIRAGTEGAFLEAALQQTAEFLERQEELRAKSQRSDGLSSVSCVPLEAL